MARYQHHPRASAGHDAQSDAPARACRPWSDQRWQPRGPPRRSKTVKRFAGLHGARPIRRCGYADTMAHRRDGASRAEAIRQTAVDEMKQAAAEAALEYVRPGMTVGVGTGSTAAWFVAALARRRDEIVAAVASSEATAAALRAAGIAVVDLAAVGSVPAVRRRRRRGRSAAAAHQGWRRRAHARKGRGDRRRSLRLHRRRDQARGATRRRPRARRGAAGGRRGRSSPGSLALGGAPVVRSAS